MAASPVFSNSLKYHFLRPFLNLAIRNRVEMQQIIVGMWGMQGIPVRIWGIGVEMQGIRLEMQGNWGKNMGV